MRPTTQLGNGQVSAYLRAQSLLLSLVSHTSHDPTYPTHTTYLILLPLDFPFQTKKQKSDKSDSQIGTTYGRYLRCRCIFYFLRAQNALSLISLTSRTSRRIEYPTPNAALFCSLCTLHLHLFEIQPQKYSIPIQFKLITLLFYPILNLKTPISIFPHPISSLFLQYNSTISSRLSRFHRFHRFHSLAYPILQHNPPPHHILLSTPLLSNSTLQPN